ncbi:hypothetical protein ACTXT7_016119 [Hymenolepis weldensis]
MGVVPPSDLSKLSIPDVRFLLLSTKPGMENRHLLRIFLKTMCKSSGHGGKYPGNNSNGRMHLADTVKSTTISSPDAFLVTDALHNHVASASSVNNSNTNSNHEYFARSRNRFAVDGDLTTGILRQTMSDGSSGIGDDFKSAVLVPLEVAQLPTQYYYNPQSPHHNAPVMAPSSEYNEVGRILHSPGTDIAYSDSVGNQHFYPKSRKQFVNKVAASPSLIHSYYMDGKNRGF